MVFSLTTAGVFNHRQGFPAAPTLINIPTGGLIKRY
jgi:hypothetical protein